MGWEKQCIAAGQVDLIPSRLSQIPRLMEAGKIAVDAAFVQITPPDKSGYCSLGVAVDVARVAMEQARLRVGDINPQVPRTFADVLASNTGMIKIFKRSGLKVNAELDQKYYSITMEIEEPQALESSSRAEAIS